MMTECHVAVVVPQTLARLYDKNRAAQGEPCLHWQVAQMDI